MATPLPVPGTTPRVVWAEMINEAILSREADAATAIAEKITSPASALADGQLIQWDAATSRFIPANPTGESELAAAENITTAVTALSTTGGAGTIVAIPFTAISISDSNGRPVTLEYQAQYSAVTNPGVGTAFLLLYETTSGDSLISQTASPLPNSVSTAQQQRAWSVMQKRIGVVSTTRTFELRAYLFTEAGDNANANVANHPNRSTILRAVAG